ncbi:MAG: SCP2 sterol-binding domain-containing protein, partial [Paracoccaceae bacterium]
RLYPKSKAKKMNKILDHAVARLSQKISHFDSVVKFSIIDEGVILLDKTGISTEEGPSEVTLTATADTFEKILSGELSAMTAYMSEKLQVSGEMSVVMRLARELRA